jgi:hypothetical protein
MASSKNVSVVCSVLSLAFAGLLGCRAADQPTAGTLDKQSSETLHEPIRPISPITLQDLDGATIDPFREVTDPVNVFVFLRTDCPIGNRYAPEIKQLHEQFAAEDLAFWLVYPDPAESPEMIRNHVKEYGLAGRVLRDPQHELVELTRASITPETAVFVNGNELVYRGRIDNRFVDFGKTRTVTTTHELRDVLKSAVAGKVVTVPWEKAVGCPIPELRGTANAFPAPPAKIDIAAETYSPRPAGTITFNEHIAPIFHAKCSTCHRPGEAAPFSLLTFDDVVARAEQIVEVTQHRYMPPWHPVAKHGQFAETRNLTVQQVGMIAQWVREKSPKGDTPLPEQPQWPDGWKLGTPDLVIKMSEAYELTAEGIDVFRNFVIPIPTKERRYVSGFEFRSTAPQIVHHARMFLDESQASRERDERDPGPGFANLIQGAVHDPAGHWLGWTPGKQPTRLPLGIAWELEPNTDLVLELHMMPSGKPESVQVSMGLYFSDAPPTQIPQVIRLGPRFLNIPPGEKNHVVRDAYRLPVDVTLRSVYAHAHYLGKQVLGYAVLPDGSKKWLLRIDQWDFNWQDEYRYAEPIFLPRGSLLTMQFVYDNSSDNFRNPHVPPERIYYGLESRSEMAELWLQVVPANRRQGEALARDYIEREDQMQIAGYRREIGARPKLAEPRFRLAEMLAARNELAEATRLYDTGFEIDPDHAVARNNFGVLLAKQGKIAEAYEHFRRAVQIDPDYYDAEVNLEKSAAFLGRE